MPQTPAPASLSLTCPNQHLGPFPISGAHLASLGLHVGPAFIRAPASSEGAPHPVASDAKLSEVQVLLPRCHAVGGILAQRRLLEGFPSSRSPFPGECAHDGLGNIYYPAMSIVVKHSLTPVMSDLPLWPVSRISSASLNTGPGRDLSPLPGHTVSTRYNPRKPLRER